MTRRVFLMAICFISILTLSYLGSYGNLSAVHISAVTPSLLSNATVPGSSDPDQDEWPMYRGQLNHTGVANTVAETGTVLFWNRSLGTYLVSSPAVVGGRVYIGSNDYKLYCLNASTGAHFWNYTTGSGVSSSPAVAGERVYVGSDDFKIYCLNASTGAHLWNYTTGNTISPSPAVASGSVYIGSSDGKLYSLNATTGEQLWNFSTGSQIAWSSPAIADGRLYVGSDDRKLYCLNATIGGQLWNYTTGDVVRSSPAIADGRVYMGSGDNKVYCLNATTGDSLWNYTTGSSVQSSPAVAGGRVYVASWDDKVYCLNATTGGQLWNYSTGYPVFSSPIIAGERVYVGGCKLFCLNASSGDPLWTYDTIGGTVWASPAVAGGRVYVSSENGKLYCLPCILETPILDTSPPIYSSVMESADPLELGSTETITIAGVADLSGIQTVVIEFEGNNHTMNDLGGGTWSYNMWTPSSIGNYPYTIYIQDTAGNWNKTSGTIEVKKITSNPIPVFPLPLVLLGVLIILGLFTLNRKPRR